MKIAIHQPHYFPWIGYFDKMAKVDKFVLLDEVQLHNGSPMFRNKFISPGGSGKYLSVSYDKNNFMNKKYNAIMINAEIDWQKQHSNSLNAYYKKTLFFQEIWEIIKVIFERNYIFLNDICVDTIHILRKILDINTEIIMQSNLNYDINSKKNDLILDICKALNTTTYLSGQGAKNYMKLESFKKENIQVFFQDFEHPIYDQINSNEFIPGISTLDILFNCGIEKTKRIFWNNINELF